MVCLLFGNIIDHLARTFLKSEIFKSFHMYNVRLNMTNLPKSISVRGLRNLSFTTALFLAMRLTLNIMSSDIFNQKRCKILAVI